jgi:hypothetical protein
MSQASKTTSLYDSFSLTSFSKIRQNNKIITTTRAAQQHNHPHPVAVPNKKWVSFFLMTRSFCWSIDDPHTHTEKTNVTTPSYFSSEHLAKIETKEDQVIRHEFFQQQQLVRQQKGGRTIWRR